MKTAVLMLLLSQPATGELVQRLVDAGKFEQAQALIPSLPPEQRARFAGALALGRGQFERAVTEFETALELTPEDAGLALYLSHAYLLSGRAEEALKAAESAHALSDQLAQPLLRARALLQLKRTEQAYDVVAQIHRRFPEELAPIFELARAALTLKMTQRSLQWAAKLPASEPGRALALFEMYAGLHQALPLLETVAARLSDNADVQAAAARNYAALDMPLASANLFGRAAHLGAATAFEAAEQYRVAGDSESALRWNRRVSPPQRRQRQRLAILFDQGSYQRVVAMTAPSEAADVYRFAYAHFALGQLGAAEAYAKRLQGTDYAVAAEQLLTSMGRHP